MKKFFGLYILAAVSILCSGAVKGASLPRAEYPRPQFERADWQNLNGRWTYIFDFSDTGFQRGYQASTGFDGSITVPFAPESELSGVGYKDYISNIWYHRTISIPQEWAGKNIRLNFGAVYYTSEVYIDGQFVGRHFGGSSSFSYDITRFVSDGKEHNLVVKASSDLRSGLQGAGKQSLQYASHACNYTRTTGIWQTVWMEPVSPAGLQNVQVITDIDQKQVIVHPWFFAETSGHTLKVTLIEGEKTVVSKTVRASNSSTVVLPVRKVRLWSPEDPFLYGLVYEVIDAEGNVVDRIDSYTGMRKVHIEGNKVYLNNQPYYQRLVLDQGFYPDGIWTAPSDEALKKDIELSMQAGFNGARLHQKVFEERYYYWADRLGYLTWGESASWGMDANDPLAARNFLAEWEECVVRDRNHPSIVTWTPMNEEFWPDDVQYPRFSEDIYTLTKQLDPTRPVNLCSGGVLTVHTDIWTAHHYEQDPAKLKDIVYNGGKMYSLMPQTYKGRIRNIGFNDVGAGTTYDWQEYDGKMPYILDEFGGIKWVKDQDRQAVNSQTVSWGYGQAPRSLEEFYARLEGMVDALLSLSGQMCGYCYTQLTDVEQEENGVYFYDRSPKFDMSRINAIFSRTPEGYANGL